MVSGQTTSDLFDMMAEFPCRDHVCFTTGEPTLNPLLPWLVRTAQELGYREVALITNGRKLADAAYLHRLLDAGLNVLTISIHGGTQKLHEGLTRTPGSFSQTLRGIRNAAPWVRLHTSTVVTRRNLPHLAPLLALLHRLGVNQAILNVAKPRGRAGERASRVLAPYRDIALALGAALSRLGPEAPPVFLEDVPRCATTDLPDQVRGVLEHNLRYDLETHDGRSQYEQYDRSRTEGMHRTKRSECDLCSENLKCEGVWTRYIDVHGWEGLDPME